jgi:hypothetical protein
MKDIIEKILLKIRQMPDEEFAEKLMQYREDEVAATLRKIQDVVAQDDVSQSFFIEKFFRVMNTKPKLHISPEEFEAYLIAACAANDERFALAA